MNKQVEHFQDYKEDVVKFCEEYDYDYQVIQIEKKVYEVTNFKYFGQGLCGTTLFKIKHENGYIRPSLNNGEIVGFLLKINYEYVTDQSAFDKQITKDVLNHFPVKLEAKLRWGLPLNKKDVVTL